MFLYGSIQCWPPPRSHAGTQLERTEKTLDLVRAEKVGADDARAEAADKAKRAEGELKLRKEGSCQCVCGVK